MNLANVVRIGGTRHAEPARSRDAQPARTCHRPTAPVVPERLPAHDQGGGTVATTFSERRGSEASSTAAAACREWQVQRKRLRISGSGRPALSVSSRGLAGREIIVAEHDADRDQQSGVPDRLIGYHGERSPRVEPWPRREG